MSAEKDYEQALSKRILGLRKTSLSPELSKNDSKVLFSDGKVSNDTLTCPPCRKDKWGAEKEVLDGCGESGVVGILRKFSIYWAYAQTKKIY